jgi:hypothetical protein
MREGVAASPKMKKFSAWYHRLHYSWREVCWAAAIGLAIGIAIHL